jgi:hypothetical protein
MLTTFTQVKEVVRMSHALVEAMKDPADVEQVNVYTNDLIAGLFRDTPEGHELTTGPQAKSSPQNWGPMAI